VEDRVFESEHKLRHLPFFEFIAKRQENDPEWRFATAGLVVLRLVDAWVEEGQESIADDAWAIPNVRAAIDGVDRGTPIRSLLGRVLDGIEQAAGSIRELATPLMAFGQALEFDAHWSLAADVYHTVLAHSDPIADADSTHAAHIRLGECYHNLGQHTEARATLRVAEDIATNAGDVIGILRARLEQAKVDLVEGKYTQADATYEETVNRAQGSAFDDVRSRALHGRANVAFNRGQYELSIQVAYQAMRCSQSPRERDRILGSIAVAFLELGVYSAARDAFMVLSATAQEQFVRWAATLNLLEIASQTSAETLFELHRRQLANQPLPPRMSTSYHLNVGLAYRRFGNYYRARVHLERAFAQAGEHGFTKYLLEAEEALHHLQKPAPPLRQAATLSLDTEEVAAAIHSMREVATAT
jgi:tetratricopeptide (TPR) repeat protein